MTKRLSSVDIAILDWSMHDHDLTTMDNKSLHFTRKCLLNYLRKSNESQYAQNALTRVTDELHSRKEI